MRRASTGAAIAIVALALVPCLVAGWRTGRATFYGGPSSLGDAFDKVRGTGSFGILAYGSCGYTNTDGSLIFPQDQYAAAADANVDFPGSCGRCYDARCVDGVVLMSPGNPLDISTIAYLPGINRTFKDTKGRSWLGNAAESKKQLQVKCWSQNKTVRVRIADSCPCIQVLKDTDPGVKPGGEVRRQEWCCGGEHHFDLSYWAFEQLAHPLYGTMMLQFRPVDCNSGAELNFDPGFVSRTVFRNGPQAGWGISQYLAKNDVLNKPGYGPNKLAALCTTLSPGGVLTFRCRQCYKPGYQPFKSATALTLWVRSNSNSSDPYVSSTPKGTLPGLKLFLYKEETNEYCGAEPVLGRDSRQDQKNGSWYKQYVAMSAFKCGNGLVDPTNLDVLGFQNIAVRDAVFCLADVNIV